MILVFLHGDPATGKYTVGRELAALTGYELYHNHVVVDEVLKLHAFGTPGFVHLRDRMWREFFARSAQAQPSGVIFTFNPENTVPQAFIEWLFVELPSHNVQVRSIKLAASEAAIEARLATNQRQQFRKLTDLGFYRQLRAAGSFDAPLIPRTDLRVDTEKLSPPEAAAVVARFLSAQA
jgi:hypothetical protein